MARVQLALKVADLEASIDFYSKLFNAEPAKRRPGYANFAIAEPPLKLVLLEGEPDRATVFDHLGVEVETSEIVNDATRRLSGEGLETTTEEQVSCCYAVQDRVWVYGPGAEPWEIYVVKGEADTSGDGGVLSLAEINRALLARQLLLERRNINLVNVLEHLVGVSAPDSSAAAVGLWSRLPDFDVAKLAALFESKQAVRMTAMRGRAHIVSARDSVAIWPWVQPALAAGVEDPVAGLTRDEIAIAGRAMLAEEPRTTDELRSLLAGRWPDVNPDALVAVAAHLLPLVQASVFGLSTSEEAVEWATLDTWLGRATDEDSEPDRLILRYLSVFGPAAVRDAEYWSGVTGLKEAFDRLRPQLKTFRDDRGKELFDLPNAPRPGADAEAPVRFLPASDAILRAHADRTRIISDDHGMRVFLDDGGTRPVVLVDGYVAGVWEFHESEGSASVRVTPFKALSGAAISSVREEGEQLLTLLAPEAGERVVDVDDPA